MRLRTFFLCLCIAAAMTVAARDEGAADGWRHVTGPPELDLPRDHGAHPEFRTEC